ncbi:FAD binding domain-containing protein [Streptomyces sp. NPDC056883]|uniref:FAD binding domain-containing protein n=1 Tax=Streptomyces sp. NPDC056883 TaxID=3345959 RepID=UPI0036794109
MEFLRPADWGEALAAKAAHPTAVPIAGGTDVMVEINFDHRRPGYLLDLNRIAELREWEVGEDAVRLGASVPYAQIMEGLHRELPGLALAPHTVASPQIRNRGSVGGNLGTASPAGDAHPALLAAGAPVEAESVRGSRLIPIDAFCTGVKRNAPAPDELIRAVHVTKAAGPQQYSKVGTRNAMVIAVCAFGLAKRFAELCAGAANPIHDVRGTASYRKHAVGIMARRALGWTWESYRRGTGRGAEGVA